MKICDLININELSVNLDQVKYFSTHTLLGNPTDTYARRVSTGVAPDFTPHIKCMGV